MQVMNEQDFRLLQWVGGGMITLIGMAGGGVAWWRKDVAAAKRRREADEKDAAERALARDRQERRGRRIYRELKAMGEETKKIKYELSFNGGGSLKDLMAALRSDLQFEIAARRRTEHRAVYEGLVMLDGTVQPVSVSEHWTRVTGLSLDDMRNGGWSRCIAPHDLDRVCAIAEKSRTTHTTFHATYDVVNVLTGETTKVRHNGFPITNSANKLIGWVGEMIPIYNATPPRLP